MEKGDRKQFNLQDFKVQLTRGDYTPEIIPDSFIYKITNTIDGKAYIGRTTRIPEKRWREHLREAPKRGSRSLIHEALKRHGEGAFRFEVIAIVPKSIVDIIECNFIEHYNTLAPNGYNCVKLYSGPRISDETRLRMSKARQGKRPWNKGAKGKQVAWNKGVHNTSRQIPIVAVHIKTGKVTEFESSMDAVRELKLNSGHVTQCCKGNLSQHKGYRFMYLSDYKVTKEVNNVKE